MKERAQMSFDDVLQIDKTFKEKLPMADRSWEGIGKHIGRLAQEQFRRRRIELDGFNLGDIVIPSNYMRDYFSGESSFGCFFKGIRDFCELGVEEIFDKQSNPNEDDMKNMFAYLGSPTYESFVHLLTIKPGRELREHVSRTLKVAREELFADDFDGSEEKDFARWFGDIKSGERFDESWMNYRGLFEGRIIDGRVVSVATCLGLSPREVLPILPFDKWRDSMKFETYYRSQLNGIGPVAGTRLDNLHHINPGGMPDVEHYEHVISVGPGFYLMNALPVLSED